MRTWLAAIVMTSVLTGPVLAETNLGWTRFNTGPGGFSVELPLGQFAPSPTASAAAPVFVEQGGTGQISLYSGDAAGLTLEAFASQFGAQDASRQITYQAEGKSWFVLSGIYAVAAGSEPLIFYTKVLLSPDAQRFTGFEISYPAAQKARFDTIVDRIEDSFSRPR